MEWLAEHWTDIMFFAGIADVVVGSLPQSWTKYTGVVLSTAKALREFDVKRKS